MDEQQNSERGLAENALEKLKALSGAEGRLDARSDGTAVLEIEQGGTQAIFEVLFRKRLGKEAAAQVAAAEETPPEKNVLVVAEHVTEAAGALLRGEGIGYLDAAGNCYVRAEGLLLFVSGRKEERSSERRRRAFQKAGLKVIFALLEVPALIGAPYRTIAETTGVSRGAVGYVTRDLEALGHVERSGRRRVLARTPALAERWATGYAETLRPELTQGRFRFVGEGQARWKQAELEPGTDWWGGEPAADLLTGHLRPEQFTLYTRGGTSPDVLERLRVIPDADGPLEILTTFWTPKLDARTSERRNRVTSPLLVYADLLASGASRNLEIARMIRDQHLTEEAFRERREDDT